MKHKGGRGSSESSFQTRMAEERTILAQDQLKWCGDFIRLVKTAAVEHFRDILFFRETC